MQILSAQPLVDQFRFGTFKESDIGPYVIATVIFESVMWAMSDYGEATFWGVLSSIAVIVLTIFGILYLKKQNGGSFGDGFVLKFFALGWVVTMRLLLISVPAGAVLFALAAIAGGERSIEPMGLIFTLGFTVAEYLWLGSLIAETCQTPQRRDFFEVRS